MAIVKADLEAGDKVVKLKDTVKFKVGYGKDFKGTKYLKDGKTVTLHRLHAERLEKKDVGAIVKDK